MWILPYLKAMITIISMIMSRIGIEVNNSTAFNATMQILSLHFNFKSMFSRQEMGKQSDDTFTGFGKPHHDCFACRAVAWRITPKHGAPCISFTFVLSLKWT